MNLTHVLLRKKLVTIMRIGVVVARIAHISVLWIFKKESDNV